MLNKEKTSIIVHVPQGIGVLKMSAFTFLLGTNQKMPRNCLFLNMLLYPLKYNTRNHPFGSGTCLTSSYKGYYCIFLLVNLFIDDLKWGVASHELISSVSRVRRGFQGIML